jgi:hypothetical protein
MKESTTDRTAGKLPEVKGALKQAAGAGVRDRDIEGEGRVEKKIEKKSGKGQGVVGRFEKALGK